MLALSLALAGCESLKRRGDTAKPPQIRKHETESPLPQNPQTRQQPQPQVEPFLPTAQVPPAPSPPPPTFLSKELPKVGLILGPGGMKAYAHIGVLRELGRARIPVHAVAGIEWGAVIGALYAQAGQANEAEWKAFKLREQDIPAQAGFLSSRIKAQPVSVLADFFETVFAGGAIEKTKVDFACPAYWSRVDRFGWMNKGPLKEAMRACLPYPPMFTDNAGVTAAPFSVDESAAYLRGRGANLIVLVNVLGQGEFLPPKMLSEQVSDNMLWSEIRREMLRAHSPNIHFVVNVNTTGHPITDVGGRRALMDAGAKAAGEVVNKMVTQYGF